MKPTPAGSSAGHAAAKRTTQSLNKRILRLQNALQAISNEAVEHYEYNSVGNVSRLPIGYRKILNIADNALNS